MWLCKIIGHKLIQPINNVFCQRCGLDKNMVQVEGIIKGQTQFIEPVPFQEKWDKAKNITDLIK